MLGCVVRELWQKKPLLVRRKIPEYNEGWFSTQELDTILQKVGAHSRIQIYM